MDRNDVFAVRKTEEGDEEGTRGRAVHRTDGHTM